MKTETITRTVVRTADSTREVTVEIPEASTDVQIRDALLAKAHNMVFSTERHCSYHLLGEQDIHTGAEADADVRWILDELVKLGFHEDGAINGADAVEVMKMIFNELTGDHHPTPYTAHFIYSASEAAFWSDQDGWVDLESATPFYQSPKRMPNGAFNDARMVTSDQAETLSKYWQEDQDAPNGVVS